MEIEAISACKRLFEGGPRCRQRLRRFRVVHFQRRSLNQFRLVTSLRKDYYQIPYDPFPNDLENG